VLPPREDPASLCPSDYTYGRRHDSNHGDICVSNLVVVAATATTTATTSSVPSQPSLSSLPQHPRDTAGKTFSEWKKPASHHHSRRVLGKGAEAEHEKKKKEGGEKSVREANEREVALAAEAAMQRSGVNLEFTADEMRRQRAEARKHARMRQRVSSRLKSFSAYAFSATAAAAAPSPISSAVTSSSLASLSSPLVSSTHSSSASFAAAFFAGGSTGVGGGDSHPSSNQESGDGSGASLSTPAEESGVRQSGMVFQGDAWRGYVCPAGCAFAPLGAAPHCTEEEDTALEQAESPSARKTYFEELLGNVGGSGESESGEGGSGGSLTRNKHPAPCRALFRLRERARHDPVGRIVAAALWSAGAARNTTASDENGDLGGFKGWGRDRSSDTDSLEPVWHNGVGKEVVTPEAPNLADWEKRKGAYKMVDKATALKQGCLKNLAKSRKRSAMWCPQGARVEGDQT